MIAVDFTAQNYGYVSPRLRGRVDLDFYSQSLDYLLNYVVTAQGEANYRTGSIFVNETRGNKVARIIPFIYETSQAYIVEITEKKMRFYKDHGIITDTPLVITGITQANPAVLTYTGTDPANGDPMIINSVTGMHQLNGREVKVTNVNAGANTFELQTVDGVNINTTAFSAYVSGGEVAKIIEINTPYSASNLFEMDYTQTNNEMYITHGNHAPAKLTRSAHTAWTLTNHAITANPFASTALVITGITKANPAVVTYTGTDPTNGDKIYISEVAGMLEINGTQGVVANVNAGANTFEISGLNSTAFTAYASGGKAQVYTGYPAVVTLADGRLIYGASDAFPTRLWFSVAGDIDNMTTGINDADAMIFTVRSDQANKIRWIAGAEDYTAFGTSGSEFKISGGGQNDAITPTNISIRSTSFNGSAAVRPIRLDSYILFLQRNGKTLRSHEYNALQDGYTAPDRTLLADHIGKSKIKQMAYTAGTPNIIWNVRNDGKMAALTFDPAQQVVAWHPHNTQGNYYSIATIPEENDDDELWQVVERTVGGVTKRFVEYTPNVPEIPVPEDYFTGEDNKDADMSAYYTALWKIQKTLLHADAALIYDGRDAATVDIEITGALTTDTVVSVEASAPFFTAAMVGRRIQSPNGGQIEITSWSSTTVVAGVVKYDLEDDTFVAGDWFLMASTLTGFYHLEGKDVVILADGGIIAGKTVTNGSVALDEPAGYVIVGLGYTGIGKTQNIETGNIKTGRSQTQPKVVNHLGVRFRASTGTKFGTSLYNLEHPQYREPGEVPGRPPRLFDGVMQVHIPDGWGEDKNLYWLHNTPTPSNIQYIMAHADT